MCAAGPDFKSQGKDKIGLQRVTTTQNTAGENMQACVRPRVCQTREWQVRLCDLIRKLYVRFEDKFFVISALYSTDMHRVGLRYIILTRR